MRRTDRRRIGRRAAEAIGGQLHGTHPGSKVSTTWSPQSSLMPTKSVGQGPWLVQPTVANSNESSRRPRMSMWERSRPSCCIPILLRALAVTRRWRADTSPLPAPDPARHGRSPARRPQLRWHSPAPSVRASTYPISPRRQRKRARRGRRWMRDPQQQPLSRQVEHPTILRVGHRRAGLLCRYPSSAITQGGCERVRCP